MAHKLYLCGAVALGLAACGGNDQPNASSTPVPVPEMVDTAQVLALARATSETTSPFPVDGGLVTFSDTSETSVPILVNSM